MIITGIFIESSMKSLLLILFALMLWSSGNTESNTQPVVSTALGTVQGLIFSVGNNDIYAFLGIPYAQPPTGEMRFRKPKPVEPWTGTYNATAKSSACMQSLQLLKMFGLPMDSQLSEDCLYLNIWTPTIEKDKKLAVMVFIHGGAFKIGSANQFVYDGRLLSAMGGVVVVSINYRLGILGAFNLNVEDAPGNQGLWDQHLALTWVRDHIEAFGGDPKLVTIFGQSAGSISVGIHLISPVSQGLYHRAIMQSGGPSAPLLLEPVQESVKAATNYAKEQNCYDEKNDINAAIQCLRQMSSARVIETENEYFYKELLDYFILSYGDEFVPSLQQGPSTSVDLMAGVVADEGALMIMFPMHMRLKSENHFKDFSMEDAKTVLQFALTRLPEGVFQKCLDLYFGQVPKDASADVLKLATAHAAGDYILACPTINFAEAFSAKNPVYSYHFNHRPSSSRHEEWTGVNHADDLPFVFGLPVAFPDFFSDEERAFSLQLMQLWTSFAKTGKPTLPTVDNWPPFSQDHPTVVELKAGNFSVVPNPLKDRCNFWRDSLLRTQ